jgi:PEGA domain-containing protein
MSGLATLAVTLLAAAPASAPVPLVGDPASAPTAPLPNPLPASRGEGTGSAAASPPAAKPRVLVCMPKGSAALEPQVERAFGWASLTTLSPENVARRFPPSDASRVVSDDERRLDELLRAAEADFLGLRFDDATPRLDEAGKIVDRLPPSVRHEAAYVRVNLLQGRVAQARGDARAAEAFARAGEAAVDVELDEAEYPPAVRQAYKTARAAARARPRRAVEIASEPAGAEIEVNGQLAGRTPAKVALPQGRCFVSLARAGFKPYLAACPSERTTVTLEPAGKDGLRDQLRERIAADPAWFLEPRLLDTLAVEDGARWIVVLDRDRGRALKALVFSAAEHALKPVEPSRLLEGELDKLAAAVRGLVLRTQHLEAQAVDTPMGLPALEARAGDPGLGSAVAYVRRKGSADFLRLGLESRGAGRFSGVLPSLLASEGGWDVEYYVEGHDASGAVACRAGDAAAPLHFRRTGTVTIAGPERPSRWYLWTALGIIAAGAAATGVYVMTRSDDVSVRLVPP